MAVMAHEHACDPFNVVVLDQVDHASISGFVAGVCQVNSIGGHCPAAQRASGRKPPASRPRPVHQRPARSAGGLIANRRSR